ncbi:Thiol-disulfide oxidoreductase ResA [Candidatus Burarchaeum australiense]|nr:Thiol-disulfide oxidoreductase ResA [Candidatus Burarchaeum australiense]
MLVLTSKTFDDEVAKAGMMLVDFWAPWCGPCRMLSPIVDKLSEAPEYKGKVVFGKVNVDEEQALAGKHNIMSIPTLMLYKKGKLAEVRMGALPESDLREWIAGHLKK